MIRPLRAIVLEARYDAPASAVWHALTDTQALADWFAPFVNAGQGAGAIVEVGWDGTNMWPSTIEVWDPEKHLRWANAAATGADGVPEPRLIVDWFISTEAGQTVLRLVHSGFGEGASWDEQIDGTQGGWTYFLWHLDLCLTRHAGARRTMVSTRPKVPHARSAFWDALFDGGLLRDSALSLGDERFAIDVVTNERPSRFTARIPGLNDAILFVEVEGAKDSNFHVGFWLSTFGLDAHRTAALQRALDESVAAVLESLGGVAA